MEDSVAKSTTVNDVETTSPKEPFADSSTHEQIMSSPTHHDPPKKQLRKYTQKEDDELLGLIEKMDNIEDIANAATYCKENGRKKRSLMDRAERLLILTNVSQSHKRKRGESPEPQPSATRRNSETKYPTTPCSLLRPENRSKIQPKSQRFWSFIEKWHETFHATNDATSLWTALETMDEEFLMYENRIRFLEEEFDRSKKETGVVRQKFVNVVHRAQKARDQIKQFEQEKKDTPEEGRQLRHRICVLIQELDQSKKRIGEQEDMILFIARQGSKYTDLLYYAIQHKMPGGIINRLNPTTFQQLQERQLENQQRTVDNIKFGPE